MKNYCDYDAIVHYASGTFGSKYKTDLSEKLEETTLDKKLSEDDVNSFKDRQYKTFVTQEPIVLYRLFGEYQSHDIAARGEDPRGARVNGRYASTEFAESIIDAKIRLALKPAWFNTKMYEAKILVPAGTKISIGKVGRVELPSGDILDGGAEQILLPYGWDVAWIQGCRRVTARQLQKPPQYRPNLLVEAVKEKKKLYNQICPSCGFEDTVKLPEAERFEIMGIKGNKYTMKYKCLNPLCEYYW